MEKASHFNKVKRLRAMPSEHEQNNFRVRLRHMAGQMLDEIAEVVLSLALGSEFINTVIANHDCMFICSVLHALRDFQDELGMIKVLASFTIFAAIYLLKMLVRRLVGAFDTHSLQETPRQDH